MHTNILINAIVQQTTVLIARLSTAAGIRAPLSHIADQIFVDLANQIEAQGVSRKVAADMFGLALRTYQKKVNRIVGAQADPANTLWQSILDFLTSEGIATRRSILDKFSHEDPQTIGAILNDLVTSGLAYRTGTTEAAQFGMTPEADLRKLVESERSSALLSMIWLRIYRDGKSSVSEIAGRLNVSPREVDEAVRSLHTQGRVELSGEDDDPSVSAAQFVIPVGSSEGWEAAVFDHFQGVCNAVAQKLSQGAKSSQFSDEIGGTTLSFDVYSGHPHEKQVRELLQVVRVKTDSLWNEVAEYNRMHPPPAHSEKITFYAGQCIQGSEE
jgi:DNA-binding Lrp family transcriptional regulator